MLEYSSIYERKRIIGLSLFARDPLFDMDSVIFIERFIKAWKISKAFIFTGDEEDGLPCFAFEVSIIDGINIDNRDLFIRIFPCLSDEQVDKLSSFLDDRNKLVLIEEADPDPGFSVVRMGYFQKHFPAKGYKEPWQAKPWRWMLGIPEYKRFITVRVKT